MKYQNLCALQALRERKGQKRRGDLLDILADLSER